MKKFICLIALFQNISLADVENGTVTKSSEIKIFTENNKTFGLKRQDDNKIIVKPQYKKIIRLGEFSFIVQKKNKFGLIDLNGNILAPVEYTHVDRMLGKYLKIGKNGKYALYNEKGEQLLERKYSSIDLLFGEMLLTCQNYKYGVVDYNGKTILENKFDDIYMPQPNIMRIKYNFKSNIRTYRSIVSFTDYLLKLFSSISPSHEKTIDELMLSQGADTMSIFVKLMWLPKYPFVYAKNYYNNFISPNNGPLSELKYDLKRQIK